MDIRTCLCCNSATNHYYVFLKNFINKMETHLMDLRRSCQYCQQLLTYYSQSEVPKLALKQGPSRPYSELTKLATR